MQLYPFLPLFTPFYPLPGKTDYPKVLIKWLYPNLTPTLPSNLPGNYPLPLPFSKKGKLRLRLISNLCSVLSLLRSTTSSFLSSFGALLSLCRSTTSSFLSSFGAVLSLCRSTTDGSGLTSWLTVSGCSERMRELFSSYIYIRFILLMLRWGNSFLPISRTPGHRSFISSTSRWRRLSLSLLFWD